MITVKDLQELLSKFHPDDVVILAKDPEGNGYAPLYEGLEDHYWAEEKHLWYVEKGEEPPPGVIPCVVLWPVN